MYTLLLEEEPGSDDEKQLTRKLEAQAKELDDSIRKLDRLLEQHIRRSWPLTWPLLRRILRRRERAAVAASPARRRA
jgi:hypothetical protein